MKYHHHVTHHPINLVLNPKLSHWQPVTRLVRIMDSTLVAMINAEAASRMRKPWHILAIWRWTPQKMILSNWWFQPPWKILVRLDHHPNYWGKKRKLWYLPIKLTALWHISTHALPKPPLFTPSELAVIHFHVCYAKCTAYSPHRLEQHELHSHPHHPHLCNKLHLNN